MSRMNARIVLLIIGLNLFLTALYPQPAAITGFNELTTSLFAGEKVRMVIHYNKSVLSVLMVNP